MSDGIAPADAIAAWVSMPRPDFASHLFRLAIFILLP